MASVDGFSIPHTVLRHFDLTSTPFTETFNRDVAERRRTYPDSAIFLDQLLSLASIDGPSSYPPTTPAALRRLIHTIRSAQIDRLKQDCFLYYLLLDYDHHASTLPNGHTEHLDEGTMDEDEPELAVVRLDKGKGKERAKVHERADGFARRRCLPQMWRGFIFGYWALDHGLWEDAVQALSDPAITSLNFLPSIFTLLSTHVSPPSRSLSLIHTLFTALGPPLDTERMVTLRTISLAHASLANAFNFIRVRPPSERPKLREDTWLWALGAPRIPLGQGPPSVQPSILTQLLHLPLIPEESAHLLQFLTHPPRSLQLQSLDLLHELITVRMIHQGQYAECLALDKQLAGSQAGNQEDRQKRRERVKEFIAILPEAQRRVLEIDGEDRRGEVLQNGPIWDEGGDVDMPSTESRSNTAPIIAPAPTRLPTLLSLTNGHTPSHPSSPAIRNLTPKPSRNVSSPFSGPPQFARLVSQSISTPTRSSPVQKLVSGSPFQQPSPRGAVAVEVPRPSRRIIDDDDMDEESVLGKRRSTRSRQVSGRSRMSSTPVKPVQAPPSTTWDNEEHADKAVENDDEHDEPAQTQQNSQQDTTEMPPPPVPSSTRPRATRPAPKSAKKPSQPTPSLPPPSPTTSTATRSTRRQSTVPPESPGLGGPMPGSFTPSRTPTTAVQNGRARITRSASRAVLDEDNDQDPGPLPKKAKTSSGVKGKARGTSQAPSDMTEESGVRRSMRRGTREVSVASSTGGRSRRIGSPTPSVASTTRSGRQGSATPRAGRGKK